MDSDGPTGSELENPLPEPTESTIWSMPDAIVHIDQMSIMNFEDTFLQTCITFEMFFCHMILRSI